MIGILMSSSSRPYVLGLNLASDRAGFVYASTSKPFISSIILKVETTSASSSTTRIFLGLLILLLQLVVMLMYHRSVCIFDTNNKIDAICKGCKLWELLIIFTTFGVEERQFRKRD